MIRLAERRQRQRIGRGAVEDEVHLAVRLKQVAKGIGGFGRPRIVAIRRDMPAVGGFHRLPGLRTDSRVVVAGKLLVQILFGNFSHGASSIPSGQTVGPGIACMKCRRWAEVRAFEGVGGAGRDRTGA